MVIPWVGFPPACLIRQAEPTGAARIVAFTTLKDVKQMPKQNGAAMRTLKGNWKGLHWLIYAASIATALHDFWLVQEDATPPAICVAVLTALLGLRLYWARRRL